MFYVVLFGALNVSVHMTHGYFLFLNIYHINNYAPESCVNSARPNECSFVSNKKHARCDEVSIKYDFYILFGRMMEVNFIWLCW